jgi:hypothetical protein
MTQSGAGQADRPSFEYRPPDALRTIQRVFLRGNPQFEVIVFMATNR